MLAHNNPVHPGVVLVVDNMTESASHEQLCHGVTLLIAVFH